MCFVRVLGLVIGCLGIVLFVLVWLLAGLFQLLKFAVFGLCLVLLIDWFGL